MTWSPTKRMYYERALKRLKTMLSVYHVNINLLFLYLGRAFRSEIKLILNPLTISSY